MWEAGKRIFSTEFSMKTPDLKCDSRVLANFDGVGRIEVAGVWFWMTQVSNQEPPLATTPVVRKAKKDKSKVPKTQKGPACKVWHEVKVFSSRNDLP